MKKESGIMNQESKKQVGFSIIETLLVLAILAMIILISFASFPGFNSRQALDKDTYLVKATIEQARSLTLAGKNDSAYGVHFSSSSATVFPAPTYSAGNSANEVSNLMSKVQISAITLTGGGSDIIFERLTGNTTQDGTIKLSLRSDAQSSSTIAIYKT
jgi:type II secretory pathway pseudopilin PulG